jgi:hypothetical protein
MKSAVPWILIVALLGGGFFLYSANKDKDAQIAKLTQDTADVDGLRKENDELKKQSVTPDEVARLRKDNEEVLKLRNEVQRLRGENKELNSQLASQLAAAQAQGARAQQAKQEAEKLAAENAAMVSQAANTKIDNDLVCIKHLRVIDAAKQQWALENKKSPTDVPTADDLAPYLPKDAPISCPAGGTYSINAVNQPPTCTVPGHELK